jgi:hypothetical protein
MMNTRIYAHRDKNTPSPLRGEGSTIKFFGNFTPFSPENRS